MAKKREGWDMLNNAHWTMANYKQRMTTASWRKILLEERDTIMFHGHLWQLKAKPLGAGVVEVYKAHTKH